MITLLAAPFLCWFIPTLGWAGAAVSVSADTVVFHVHHSDSLGTAMSHLKAGEMTHLHLLTIKLLRQQG